MTNKQKQNRKNLIKERAAAMQTSKKELATMQAEAEKLEADGKWDEATIAWGTVADYATGANKKRAAGKQAAAKVRASAAAQALEAQMDSAERGKASPSAVTPVGDGSGMLVSTATSDGERAYHEAQAAARAEDEGETRAATPEEMAAEAAATKEPKAKKEKQEKPAPAPKERDPRLPPAGTVLVKKGRDGIERVRATVLEVGIEYAGATYKTLSAAGLKAMADLGLEAKTCDGFAFWGLKKSERAAAPPKEIDFEALGKAWDRYLERAQAAAKVEDAEQRAKVYDMLGQHSGALNAIVSMATVVIEQAGADAAA